MGNAMRQLLRDGPAAATRSIQHALAAQISVPPADVGTAFRQHARRSGDAEPTMKDLNPTPAWLNPERGVPAAPPLDGASFEPHSYSGPAGTRGYKLYIPSRRGGGPMPLVVMLHGCTQDPDDFAAGTRMNQAAEELGFLVAYPAQSRQANHNGCWNWFLTADQRRDEGEPSIIAGIVADIAARQDVDRRRVFAAGLSAGGAMAAILGARYPDVFAAVGIHSGLAAGAAHDLPSALVAMKAGRPGAPGGRSTVPTIVFHGDRDKTVDARNGAQAIADALASGGATEVVDERGKSPGGRKYTRRIYTRAGALVAEDWLLHGGGHRWSGGSKAGSHTDPTGPDASREMLRFFSRPRPRTGQRRCGAAMRTTPSAGIPSCRARVWRPPLPPASKG
jgi:poly(hydroxyalkanoate) depolymerase family esterase